MTETTALQGFAFEGTSVRSVMIDGKRWLVASDVATLLGYNKPHDAVQRHCKHAKRLNSNAIDGYSTRNGVTPSNGGNPNITFVNQSDTMRLICSSSLPKAEAIESWLFDTVFVSVVETGAYVGPGVASPVLGSAAVQDALKSLMASVEAETKTRIGQEFIEAESILESRNAEFARAIEDGQRLAAVAVSKIEGLAKATLAEVAAFKRGEEALDKHPPEWQGGHTIAGPLPIDDVMLGLGLKRKLDGDGFLAEVMRWTTRAEVETREPGSRQMELYISTKATDIPVMRGYLTMDSGAILVTASGRGAVEARFASHRHKLDVRGPLEFLQIRGIICGKLHAGALPGLRDSYCRNLTTAPTGFTAPRQRPLAAE